MALVYLGIEDGSHREVAEIVDENGFQRLRYTVTQTHLVIDDGIKSSSADAVLVSGVPVLYESTINNAVCRALRPEDRGSVHYGGSLVTLWAIVAEFDNEINVETQQGQGINPEDPTSYPPSVRWTSENEQQALQFDAISGDPVVTKACEKIAASHPFTIPILRYSRYEIGRFDPDIILEYTNHTNNEPFLGAPSGCALMSAIESDEKYIENSLFSLVTYVIKFKMIRAQQITRTGQPTISGGFEEDGWALKPLHQGHKYFKETNTAADAPIGSCPDDAKYAVQYLDDDGNPVPILLDQYGYALGENEQVAYLKFHKHPKASFTPLGISL